MRSIILLTAFTTLVVATAFSQPTKTALQEHLAQSALVIVTKCIQQGPVDIIGRSRTSVEIVHALKGKVEPTLSFLVRERLEPGEYYLITFRSAVQKDESSGNERNILVVPIVSADEAKGLNHFSLEIALLRTINIRMYRLESEIGRLRFELDDLKKLAKGH